LEQVPAEQRRGLIKSLPEELSIRRGCQLLGINRSTLYYEEEPANIQDIDILNMIREVWEKHPYYGYRRITKELRGTYKLDVNRKRVYRLMVLGEVKALFPGPNTSRRNKLHAVHPYLLRDMVITHPNQAWMVDITYLRMSDGFVYLVALIDVYSRYVVGWSLSNTLETEFCIDALKMGLETGDPAIINSDQGSQFTSDSWVNFLCEQDIKISMTGKGRCKDNIYIERFWRSLKQEEFYLNEYTSIKELKKSMGAYIEFYNHRRWHQALDYKRPADVYFEQERKLLLTV